jgi:hypothetical protein
LRRGLVLDDVLIVSSPIGAVTWVLVDHFRAVLCTLREQGVLVLLVDILIVDAVRDL